MNDKPNNGVKNRMSVAADGSNAKFPENKCIYHLFQEQVKRTPHKVAVVSANDRMTYQELDKKSNQFGRYLQARGVKPETLVGICLNRSINMIIGILSILKAGGAYVPIDPEYPNDRIAFMLDDSGSSILVTQTSLKSKLPETSVEIVSIDDIEDELQQTSAAPLYSNVKSDNLAYVIYTSGSTGRPKGVMIDNRNVVRLFFNDQFQFDFSEHDVWSIFHSFCFDFSVWEMYGALFFGGKAVIVPKQATKDPHAYLDIILKEKVTVINQTPSAFYGLIPYLIKVPDQASSLRYAIFGGEKLNPGKLKEIKQVCSQVKFVNMYGITETTVHVTYKEITAKEIAEGFSNIGKPIPTLKVFIFDANMHLVPKGVEGELCVGGHGVARGYLNRGELTRAKFIPNPLNPEEIIYRSGDLACMRENGDIEYFGRMDSQIQLRGFRIELGEIESVIVDLEEIKDCVVAVDETLHGDARIIAYIIPARNGISIQMLRKKILEKLPDYMIPSFFVEVDEFPLTDNGKLDLKKLPSPHIKNISSVSYNAPETDTEHRMAEIWSEILGVEKNLLGRQFNFFEIGGHSLAAIALLAQMREQFKKEATIQHIYENPNLNDLCRVLLRLEDICEQTESEKQDVDAPDSIYPIKTTQLAYWLGIHLFRIKSSNVCEVYSLEGNFDFDSFQMALNMVAKCHDSPWYPFSKRMPLIQFAEPGECAVEYIDWNRMDVKKGHNCLDDLIVEILHKPFDLSQIPLFRMAIIKTGMAKHLLLVSFPHIISDIASLNAFVFEVFDAYMPSGTKDRPTYQLRKIRTKEMIDHEIDYLKSPNYHRDKVFWQEKLEGTEIPKFQHTFFLPRRKRNASGRKLLTKISLNESTIEDLHKLSAQSNASIHMVILAIIQATLHTLSKQDRISTMMVYDMSGLYAYPPAMQLNATMITVISQFTQGIDYSDLIFNLKRFLVEALSHVRYPSLLQSSIPVFSALKDRPWLSKFFKSVGRFYAWYYSKGKVNREVIVSYFFYVLGRGALGLKNLGKRKTARYRYSPVVFNVLPNFYERKELRSNEILSVTRICDRELEMNPGVYAENSMFQDAKFLNIDLLRDRHGDAYLYVWGCAFTQEALNCIKETFYLHLNAILEDPAKPILQEEAVTRLRQVPAGLPDGQGGRDRTRSARA
jgi:amino acid adenylation domain-containing protein